MRTVKVALVMLLWLMSGATCGISPDPFDDPGRLEVNDHLRLACPSWFASDPETEAGLAAFESDRLMGKPYEEQIADGFDVCDQVISEVQSVCNACFVALANQVYMR
jgi:hypothetical protein